MACVVQDCIPFGAAALLTYDTITLTPKQGKGTAVPYRFGCLFTNHEASLIFYILQKIVKIYKLKLIFLLNCLFFVFIEKNLPYHGHLDGQGGR